MKNTKLWIASAAIALSSIVASAQESDSIGQVQKNTERISLLENDFGKFGNLKISGYLQAQWQLAESKGAAAFGDGGSFGSQIDNRFMIRRGRIKFAYTLGIVQAVIQPDFTEKGVKIKDAYIALTSKNKMIGGQFGIFDRPFGYEISYSSSLRESPERSRVFASLFPDERDMGAMLNLKYGEFTLNAGMFNGTGIAAENDSRKDFIGRLSWLKKWDKAQLGIAASYYTGGVTNTTDTHYSMTGQDGFQKIANEQGKVQLRQYFGAATQYLQDWAAGMTNIRAEFLWGKQPGTEKNNNIPSGGISGANLYLRQFVGGYVILVQDIGRSKHSVVFKYDYYDPNTMVSGDEIGKLTGTGAADIAYSTFGVGYLFRWNANLRLMAYYDMVDNELSNNLKGYESRIKQNVLTIRAQVKF